MGIVDAEAVATGATGVRARPAPTCRWRSRKSLDVVQGNDMAEIVRDSTAGGGPTLYESHRARGAARRTFAAVEDAVRQMGYGAFSLLDVSAICGAFSPMLDLLLGIFGSLALAVASLGISIRW